MENKHVGWIILGISIVIILIIFMFKSALTSFVASSCTLAHGGEYCPMYDTIGKQTYLALGIVGILVLVALAMVFSKPQEKIIIKTVEKKSKKKVIDTSMLRSDEKQVLTMIQSNKTIFQADLIDKTGFGKAKITRIIDKLEGKGLVERRRRGMTNVVVMMD